MAMLQASVRSPEYTVMAVLHASVRSPEYNAKAVLQASVRSPEYTVMAVLQASVRSPEYKAMALLQASVPKSSRRWPWRRKRPSGLGLGYVRLNHHARPSAGFRLGSGLGLGLASGLGLGLDLGLGLGLGSGLGLQLWSDPGWYPSGLGPAIMGIGNHLTGTHRSGMGSGMKG